MTITTITISDVFETSEIQTNISYDLEEGFNPDDPITPAALYGYTINWLIRTGRIKDLLPEVIAELNSLDSQTDKNDAY